MTYNVSFKSGEVYCSNLAIAESKEDVERHYSKKYEWIHVSEATESEVREAERKGKPIVTVKPEETEEQKAHRENTEHCKRIAEDLEAIAAGNVYKCPTCGEIIDLETASKMEHEEGDFLYSCPNCAELLYEGQMEQYTLWDYFNDVLDIEYRTYSDRTFKSVRLMVACGGPNIYIDTQTENVELYWWGETARYPIERDTVEEINNIFEELFNIG